MKTLLFRIKTNAVFGENENFGFCISKSIKIHKKEAGKVEMLGICENTKKNCHFLRNKINFESLPFQEK